MPDPSLNLAEVLTATIPSGNDLPMLIMHFAEENILFVALNGVIFQFNWTYISASLGQARNSVPPLLLSHAGAFSSPAPVTCWNVFQVLSLLSVPFKSEPRCRWSFAKGNSSLPVGRMGEALLSCLLIFPDSFSEFLAVLQLLNLLSQLRGLL